MKPVIGLIPLYDDEKESYWMLPGYMKVLEKCNALPLMLPLTVDPEELAQCLELCDGLLLTGGHDVGPDVYGAAATPMCGIPCHTRDQMEAWLLKHAIARDLPVFGICRGLQFINAVLGGTLYQDLPTEHPSEIEHHMSPPYNRGVHKITIPEDSVLTSVMGPGVHAVNSYHHQAVKQLAPVLRAEAWSEDGLVEAISMPGKRFIVGVQWHPEFSYEQCPESLLLVQAFVDQCARN